MNASADATATAGAGEPPQRSPTMPLLAQLVLGLGCWLFFVFPYVRRVDGLRDLPRRRLLFVSNHVSLLDTLLLGGLFWRRGRLPILVLGDRKVWQRTAIHRFLSAQVGFLIDRRQPTKGRIRELRAFGRHAASFHLIVFPEGTRGDGRTVGACQPGVYHVASEAALPIVPIFIAHMEEVSSKRRRFRPLAGLRRIVVRFGEPLPVEAYRNLDRDAFLEEMRRRIQALAPDD